MGQLPEGSVALWLGTLALKSGVPGCKPRSGYSMNLFLVVPGSTRPPLYTVNGQLVCLRPVGILTVVVVVVVVLICRFLDCVSHKNGKERNGTLFKCLIF